MGSLLLDLPNELVTRVLYDTDIVSTLRCRQTCKLLNQIINESALLQYKIELIINGMIDGPPDIAGMQTATSRLEALRAYCRAWDTLQPRKKTTIPGRVRDTNLYELWGGVWARARKAVGHPLTAIQLPSIVRGVETKTWNVPLMESGRLADFGMDPHQDLLVLIVASQDSSSPSYYVNLKSLKGGHPHPKAKMLTLDPGFHPLVNQFITCLFTVQVMGNFLGLLCEADLRGYTMSTLLVIWDWTTGKEILKEQGTFGERLINSFAFLSEKHVILGSSPAFFEAENENDAPSLDLYTLEGEVRVIRSLFFPEVECDKAVDGRVVLRQLLIRSDPAPTVIADPDHPYPFVLDPRQRLYIVTMMFEYESRYAFTMKTMHFLVPSATVFKNIPKLFGGEDDKRDPEDDLAWLDWGPMGTKFLPRDEIPSAYVCYVYGTKFVVVPSEDPSSNEEIENHAAPKRKVTVYDFSATAVRREQAGLNSNSSHPGVEVDIIAPSSATVPIFGISVDSSLLCVRRRTVEGHAFVTPMMDGDNIILLKPRGTRAEDYDMEIWTM